MDNNVKSNGYAIISNIVQQIEMHEAVVVNVQDAHTGAVTRCVVTGVGIDYETETPCINAITKE